MKLIASVWLGFLDFMLAVMSASTGFMGHVSIYRKKRYLQLAPLFVLPASRNSQIMQRG